VDIIRVEKKKKRKKVIKKVIRQGKGDRAN